MKILQGGTRWGGCFGVRGCGREVFFRVGVLWNEGAARRCLSGWVLLGVIVWCDRGSVLGYEGAARRCLSGVGVLGFKGITRDGMGVLGNEDAAKRCLSGWVFLGYEGAARR